MLPNDYIPNSSGLLYMVMDRGLARTAVYDFAQHTSRDLFPGAVGEFKVSPDGKWVAGITVPRGLCVAPFPGPGPLVPVSREGGGQPRWTGDSKRLFFVAPDRKMMEVAIDAHGDQLQPGIPHALFLTRIVGWNLVLFQYDVTADGNRFLINSLKPGAPLTLVTNWAHVLDR
jgi:hypothetical protein